MSDHEATDDAAPTVEQANLRDLVLAACEGCADVLVVCAGRGRDGVDTISVQFTNGRHYHLTLSEMRQ
jgi:hypothetical protein